METSAVAPTAARGRPRDPQLEARVYDAAIALYAESGWPGFNFDAIARLAGAGKTALYRRWPDRANLLRDTLSKRWYAVDTIDTGTIRGDLLALAMMCLRARTGPHSGAALHMMADAARFPEVRAATAPYGEETVRQARLMVRRAIARGEIPAEVNPGLLLDVVVGGVTNHVATTPVRLRAQMIAKMGGFAESLVDLVLRGLKEA